MDFEEFEDSAEEELKRADHLIYVTLKYTRTTEVIKNTIKRLINSYDFAVLEALKYLEIKEISDVPRRRVKQLEELLPELKKELKFYLMLKEIDSSPYKTKDEYRKNVTLITRLASVTVERLKELFEKTIINVKHIEEVAKSKQIKKRNKKYKLYL